MYIKERIEATSPIASAINQSAQNAAAKNENLGVNYGIVASQALANTANIFSNNLINTTSNQTLGFKFNQDKSQSSSENISKINAGDNLNLESTKGSIVLNGVEAKASSINIEAKDNVILNAAKSKILLLALLWKLQQLTSKPQDIMQLMVELWVKALKVLQVRRILNQTKRNLPMRI